jgi:ribose/xylose/arabinose/galactoside ABC-type transport system permease subunit
MVGSMHVWMGTGWEFEAITMAVVGGISLFGGRGRLIPGAFIGILLIMTIENGLNLIGASAYLYPIVKGVILFIAIASDSIKNLVRKS